VRDEKQISDVGEEEYFFDRVDLKKPGERPASDSVRVVIDVPRLLPIRREEIALLRAFLSDEIEAILWGE